jgi:hypothetical protein
MPKIIVIEEDWPSRIPMKSKKQKSNKKYGTQKKSKPRTIANRKLRKKI